jgi:hypothetical protein
LYNGNGDVEAICYVIKPAGYVIINPNNLIITEFSIEAPSPYHNQKDLGTKYIYNGPTNYFRLDGNTLTDLRTNQRLPLNELDVVSVNNYKTNLSTVQPKALLDYDTLDSTLRTWQSSHFCGVDASGNRSDVLSRQLFWDFCAIRLSYQSGTTGVSFRPGVSLGCWHVSI